MWLCGETAPTCNPQPQKTARTYTKISDYEKVFPLPKAASQSILDAAVLSHTHERMGGHAPHGWAWGGSCVSELIVSGDGPKMFLNAEAGHITSKPSNSGYVRIKEDCWQWGGGKQG